MYIFPDSMPHDDVTIVDRSTYLEDDSTPISDPISLFGFISPKGIGLDNQLRYIDQKTVKRYGTPNMTKYGVSLYNVNNYIEGGGNVLGARLMPEDSTHANLLVVAKYKLATAEPYTNDLGQQLYKNGTTGEISTTSGTGWTAITRDVIKVKLTTQSVTGADARSPEALLAVLNNKKSSTPDADGYISCPLFAVYSLPKGIYGNSVRFRITTESSINEIITTDRFYRITASDIDIPALFDPMIFTFNDELIYNGLSMYISEVFNENNMNIGAVVSPELVNTFLPVIKANGLNTDDGELDANDIDILFGLTKSSNKHYKYLLTNDSVSLSAANGLALGGGDDGAFGLTQTQESRNTAISTAMANLYNGGMTDLVFDNLRYPFLHVFDNDDDKMVKDAVENLVNQRDISFGILSMPITTKYTEVDSLRSSKFKNNTWKIAMYSESALVLDPYSGKRVRMPASYFNSYAYAEHCVNGGYATPFAGEYFKWSGFVVGTMQPQSSSVDVCKHQHANRINQMNEDGKGVAESYQQITTQSTLSKLSEINNAHILLMMIRICLEHAKIKRWSWLDDNDVATYQKDVQDIIGVKMNGMYDKVEIVTQRESANGPGSNRILATINVYFKNILKGVSYKFYIQ